MSWQVKRKIEKVASFDDSEIIFDDADLYEVRREWLIRYQALCCTAHPEDVVRAKNRFYYLKEDLFVISHGVKFTPGLSYGTCDACLACGPKGYDHEDCVYNGKEGVFREVWNYEQMVVIDSLTLATFLGAPLFLYPLMFVS